MERIPPERGEDTGPLDAAVETGGADGVYPDLFFWRRFAEATSPKEFCQSWLPLQCRLLERVRCAMVLLGKADQGPFSPAAVWPDAKRSLAHLTGAAERALKERRGLLVECDSGDRSGSMQPDAYHIAYPIEISKKLHGVVVLEVERRAKAEIQAVMQQLHWGAAWLEVLIRRAEAATSAEVNKRLQHILGLITAAVEHKTFYAAAMASLNQLSTMLDCDRVSLGIVKGGQARVRVLSHSAEFEKQSNLMRTIAAAMNEAIDQQASLVYPQPTEAVPMVVKAHESLHRQHGSGTILTIPIYSEGIISGALTLERPDNLSFDPETVETCETAAALIGPILEIKRAEERWLPGKMIDSFARQFGRLLGPGYLGRKLILLLLTGVVFFFAYVQVDYRITAPATIEGAVQRVVAAPFDGYIKEASARPGDLVKAGQVLCFLDDRDLKLERLKWSTEKEQLVKQYDQAMAKYERSQILITRAKIDQAEGQISLLDEQLARSKVTAPFDGIIISGDLSQSLGAPVERGQTLFQVTPLNKYRVVAEVDERDVPELAEGQQSELVLPCLPGEVFPFVVEKITPVSTAKEGRNYFRVEGRMNKAFYRLRPGMEGIGKIRIDRRKLYWVSMHEMLDWLRLQYWRWQP